jgi:hypothetical protein
MPAPSWYKEADAAAPSWYTPPGSAPPASAGSAPAPAAAPAKPEPSRLDKAIDGMLGFAAAGPETAAHMVSGMVAKPASDLAMIATGIPELMKPPEQATTRPLEIRDAVRRGLTYEPRSRGGQLASQYNPLALVGKGLGWAGKKANEFIAPPGSSLPRRMVGSAAEELTGDAAAFLGARFGAPAMEAAGEGAQAFGRRAMKSAIGPTREEQMVKPWQTRSVADIAADEMINRGLTVRAKNVGKLERASDKLTDAVDRAVARAPKTIDRVAMAQGIEDSLAKFRSTIKASDSFAQIQKVWDYWLDIEHPDMGVMRDIPIQMAQKIKRDESAQLKQEYGKNGTPEVEARKDVVRRLKEEIEKALPEVKPLNAENSRILKTLPLIERRTLREANRNPISLALKASDPVHFAAWVAKHSAHFQSIIAQMVDTAGAGMKQAAPLMPLAGAATMGQQQMQPPPKIPRNAAQ